MKKDWTYKKLGELTKIKTGKLDANASSADGIYPFFTCSREPLRISSYSYDCECVLVAGNGELNVKYYNGKFDAYQRTYIIEALPDSGIMTYYMYHFFNQYVETLRQKSIGGIIKYIKLGDLTDAVIPIPPLSIQRSIVAELDLLHSVISKKKEQLRELDNLAQSLFYQMFGDPITNPMGWEIKKLGEVGDIVGGSTPKTSDEKNWIGINQWVSPAELKGDKYFGKTVHTISDEAASKLQLLPKGTVLLSSRAPIGKLAITTQPMYCNQGFKNIVCGPSINNEFVYGYLQLNIPRLQSLGVGATFKEISKKMVESFPIILPPLSLQQSFAAKVSAIEVQKQAITQSIHHTEALLAQRMDNYFGI